MNLYEFLRFYGIGILGAAFFAIAGFILYNEKVNGTQDSLFDNHSNDLQAYHDKGYPILAAIASGTQDDKEYIEFMLIDGTYCKVFEEKLPNNKSGYPIKISSCRLGEMMQ